MGGNVSKQINKNIYTNMVNSLAKILKSTCTTNSNQVDIDIKSCGSINFSNNIITTSVTFNMSQAIEKINSAETRNEIMNNLKNDNFLKDDSMISAANINKNTIFNDLENTLIRNFKSITEEKLSTMINNFIKISLETTCIQNVNNNIIFTHNDISMTTNNVAQSILSQSDILKSVDATATEIENKSKTTVSNALATVINSVTSFFQSTLGMVLGIMILGFVIFIIGFFTISKETRKLLFGWIPNPFSKKASKK